MWVELCELLGVTDAAIAAPEASEWFQKQWVKVQEAS